VDRIYLLTGPEGTTVVLEHERNPPLPHWLGNFGGEPAVFSLPG